MTLLSDTIEIVKGRFHEAADVEHHLPHPTMPDAAAYWPLYLYTQEDREGWTEDTKADSNDRWARTRKLTREAISRHDECLDWSITILKDERRRQILWCWSFCQAKGWEFGESCRRRGWVKSTSYLRLADSFERISRKLLGDNVLPRLPDDKFLRRDRNGNAIKPDMGEAPRVDDSAIAWSPAWMASGAQATDLPEFRDFSWSEGQASRRARRLLNSGRAEPAPTISGPNSS